MVSKFLQPIHEGTDGKQDNLLIKGIGPTLQECVLHLETIVGKSAKLHVSNGTLLKFQWIVLLVISVACAACQTWTKIPLLRPANALSGFSMVVAVVMHWGQFSVMMIVQCMGWPVGQYLNLLSRVIFRFSIKITIYFLALKFFTSVQFELPLQNSNSVIYKDYIISSV